MKDLFSVVMVLLLLFLALAWLGMAREDMRAGVDPLTALTAPADHAPGYVASRSTGPAPVYLPRTGAVPPPALPGCVQVGWNGAAPVYEGDGCR